MPQTIKHILLFLVFAIPLGCKDKYVSPYVPPRTGYLVVEGFIAGDGPTTFTLTRSIPLPGDSALPLELKAKVTVEGSDNSVYPLQDAGNGIYSADALPLNTALKYRLHVKTANGQEYLSDLVAFIPSPPIDSINWSANADGLDIYANTHDPANATHYYQWTYEDAWEYHSAEKSLFKYKGDTTPVSVVPRDSSEQIYRCWGSSASANILLESTIKLASDVVYRHPLKHIPPNDVKTGVLYSILVRQNALSQEAFNFLTLMQKNTESLGSIFDVQPSALRGNLHCISNPALPVIGFVSAGTIRQQRIFIRSIDIPSFYNNVCPSPDTVVQLGLLQHFYEDLDFIPVARHFNGAGSFDGWLSAPADCADCRLQGGKTQKPAFWPN
jgi:hypothetical protein